MPARNVLSHTLFENRGNEIDYDRLAGLYFVGSYERRLPVSITRMMENAYDWEHLPHVHKSSFKSLALHEQGTWGWRAIATLPDSRLQHLELLVDRSENYWATTVLSGDAKGFEIHTRARELSEYVIEVQVTFYLPQAFSKILMALNLSRRLLPLSVYRRIAAKLGIERVSKNERAEVSILRALQAQYSVLYDEDEDLMSGRQQAIDHRQASKDIENPNTLIIGTVDDVLDQLPKVVQFGAQRFVINRWQDDWRVYSADCPHLLGPLEHAEIDQNGKIQCPWHGYKFDIIRGNNCDQKTRSLATPPTLTLVDGYVQLSMN